MSLPRALGAGLTSLRGRLLLLVLLSAVPLFGLSFYGYLEQRGRATSQAQAEALRLARVAAADQRRIIDDARLLLATLAALPEVRGDDPAACSRAMTRLRDELASFQSLGVIDRTGAIVCSALPEALGVNVEDRTYVQRALSTRRFAVGDYQIGRASRTANVNFGYPVLAEDGDIRAIAYASLNLNWLNRYASEARLPQGSTLTVLDSAGTILARHPDPERWIGQPAIGSPVVAALLARTAEATAEATDVDGERRLIAFVPLGDPADGATASLIVGIPSEQAYAVAERDLARDLAFLTAIGVIVLCVAGLGAERLIIRPVNALVGVTCQLHDGDLSARTGLKPGASEIRQLAHAIDEMAAALEAAEARRAEDEALRRRNFELEQQNLAIQEANRLKSEFVSMVTHEMRTPLTSVQGYIDLLLEAASGPLTEEQRRFLGIVRENADRLVALISDLLDLARIEAGRLGLHPASVHLADVIREVADSLRPLLAAKSQTLLLDLPPGLPAVWADHERVAQIVTNLLSNAHKYTPDGGHIEIAARPEGHSVVVAVRDNGIGMTEAEQSRLFTRFFRSDNPLVRRTRGTGLGLTITHALVQLHGGEMRVISSPGAGSTFSFSLPVAGDAVASP